MAEITSRRKIAYINMLTKPIHSNEKCYLVAMHSSTEIFGVAALNLLDPNKSIKTATFPIGRTLSNKIISCVEEVIPSNEWAKIARLAVATGPGGFTGTRLSISMARTLAQQLISPLDGISSFELMVPRLARNLGRGQENNPFWIRHC